LLEVFKGYYIILCRGIRKQGTVGKEGSNTKRRIALTVARKPKKQNQMKIIISETRDIKAEGIIELYKANNWSSAEKPTELYNALINSNSLITAWNGNKLVGLGNAISDGYLVVYYPHLLVHPNYQGKGIGKMIMDKMQEKYKDFHMQMLTADGKAIDFYKKLGFVRAGKTEPMWIYKGSEH